MSGLHAARKVPINFLVYYADTVHYKAEAVNQNKNMKVVAKFCFVPKPSSDNS